MLERFPTRPRVSRPERTTWAGDDLIAEVQYCRRVLGLDLAEVAGRLGMRPASIERAFQRAGLPGGRDCGR